MQVRGRPDDIGASISLQELCFFYCRGKPFQHRHVVLAVNSHQGGGEDFRTLRHDDWVTLHHITSGCRSQPKCPQRDASQNRRGGRLRSLEGRRIRGTQGYGRRRRAPSRPIVVKDLAAIFSHHVKLQK